MERNTEKSTYEKQVKMICGYKKKAHPQTSFLFETDTIRTCDPHLRRVVL